MKRIKILALWMLIGIFAVFIRRMRYYGFTYDILKGDIWIDLLIGVGTALLVGLFSSIKKTKA